MHLNRSRATAQVRLRNGGDVQIRPVRSNDAEALQRFVRELSPPSRYRRFLMAVRELPEEMLTRFTRADPQRHVVLVATTVARPAPERIIGMAQYSVVDGGAGCEVAVVVDDAWQRQELGYALFDRLLCIATHAGITHAFADVLADNHAMRRLGSKLGWRIRTNPLAPFLVQMTKTLAHKEYGRGPGFAPCLGTQNPEHVSTVMRTAHSQS